MNSRSMILQSLVVLVLAASTAQAQFPTAADVSPTREISWPDSSALLEKATELRTAAGIYEFVRNNFEMVLYDGARSNAVTTFLNRRGNDIDIASTLIAMLRSQGIPARYGSGVVSFSAAQMQNWLEIPDIGRLQVALIFAGFENVVPVTDRITFHHAWVQAFVPLDSYRGNDSASPVDCMLTPTACVWVDLDASFKQREYRDPAELVDLSDTVLFDYESYYHADDPTFVQDDPNFPQAAEIDRREKNPLEIYEEMLLQHLRSTVGMETKTLKDLVYEGEIVEERHGILPMSPPFRIDPALVSSHSSVDDFDADNSQLWDWTKRVSLEVSFKAFAPLQNLPPLSGGPGVPLADLAGQNLTIAYESTDFEDPGVPKSLVVRLGEEEHATIFTLTNNVMEFATSEETLPANSIPDTGTSIEIELTMEGANGNTLIALYPNLRLGGHFLVAAGGEFSGFAEVEQSTDRLLEAVESHPVLEDESGVLYVDENMNAVIDPGEPTLLEDAETQNLLTGGVLGVAKALYYAQLRDQVSRLRKLKRVVMGSVGYLGLLSTVHNVRAVGGTAFSITPVGLLIDMKDITFNIPYRIDSNARSPRTLRLAGHISSSLEHEVWQELTGFEAISTMKGIQKVLESGGVLMNLDEAQSETSIATAMTNWGFASSPPTSGLVYRELAMFPGTASTYDIWVPLAASSNSPQTLSVVRETVAPSSLSSEKKGWDLQVFREENVFGGEYGTLYEELFRFVQDRWDLLSGAPPNSPFPGGGSENLATDFLGVGGSVSGCIDAFTTGAAVDNYPTCLEAVLQLQGFQKWADYLEVFGKDQQTVETENLFRDTDNALHFSARDVAQFRNEIILGADQDKDGNPDLNRTVEFTVPSALAVGELLEFPLWIETYFDSAGDVVSTNYIIREAGGAYVTSSQNLTPSLDFEGFANYGFTDELLIGSINNGVFALSTNDPIATTTGNVFHDETDLRIKGRNGLGYLFTRTYNSGPTKSGEGGLPMGHGWSHSYNMRLISKDHTQEPNTAVSENSDQVVSSITYVDERGGEQSFEVSGTGPLSGWSVTNPRGVFDTLDLSLAGSSSYTLRFRNGTEYVFGGADLSALDQTARLEMIRDPNGNEIILGYTGGQLTSVQDNLSIPGRTGLTLSYDGDGRLEQVSDWTQRTWSYTYTDGNLTTYTNPLQEVTRYDYVAGTNLLSEVALPEDRDNDTKGDVVTTFSYYENGRGFSNNDSFGKGERVAYDLFRKRSRVTGPRGFTMAQYYDRNGELTKLENADGGLLFFEHNDDGRRTHRTTALGFTSEFQYDTQGRLEFEIEPGGLFSETSWAIFDQPAVSTDRRGFDTSLAYYNSTGGTGEATGKLGRIDVELDDGTMQPVRWQYYSPDGNLTSSLDRQHASGTGDLSTTYTYDVASGLNLERVVRQVGPGTIVEQFGYDGLGRTSSATLFRCVSPCETALDDVPITTTFLYDELDRVTQTTDALGNISAILYDKNGNIKEERVHYLVAPPSTYETRIYAVHEYDVADRRISTTDILQNKTRFEYDAAGNLTSSIDANGHVTRFEYDVMDRRTAVVDANGHRSEFKYDLDGRVIEVEDANGNGLFSTYDALGRLISQKNSLAETTAFSYDANGNLEQTVDANSNAVHQVYDSRGRVTEVMNAENATTEFIYDLQGNRTHVVDAKGQDTEFMYDELGRAVEVVDPRGKSEFRKYDQANNLIERTDRRGNVTRFSYDLLNRLTRVDYSTSGSVFEEYEYNVYGDLVREENEDIVYLYEYDEAHRLMKRTRDAGAFESYQYDPVGNVISKIDYQGSVTTFQYDATNRLVSLSNPSYLQISYQYDPAGNLLSRILSNGAKSTYSYDAANRLKALREFDASGVRAHELLYAYDAVGNIERVTEDGVDINYEYDAVYRLTKAEYTGDPSRNRDYTYDAVGNRTTMTTPSEVLAYFTDSGNRLTHVHEGSLAGPVRYEYRYNDNGEVIFKFDESGKRVFRLPRNARGEVKRTTLAQGAGAGRTFEYDPSGYRIRSTENTGDNFSYLLEGPHVESISEWPSGPLRAKYLRGVVIDEIVSGYEYDGEVGVYADETNLTFHHDHLRSVRSVSAHGGGTLARFEYSPFGELESSVGETVYHARYTGRELDDDTGLYYYRARFYDPTIGRFLSEDPLGFAAGDVNFYAYVGNNPLNANDPLGLIRSHRDKSGLSRIRAEFLDIPIAEVSLGAQVGFSRNYFSVLKGKLSLDAGTFRAGFSGGEFYARATEQYGASLEAFKLFRKRPLVGGQATLSRSADIAADPSLLLNLGHGPVAGGARDVLDAAGSELKGKLGVTVLGVPFGDPFEPTPGDIVLSAGAAFLGGGRIGANISEAKEFAGVVFNEAVDAVGSLFQTASIYPSASSSNVGSTAYRK